MAENQDIRYDMLEEHDQSLLKVRPLKTHHVQPLTKYKLSAFLEGNGVQFHKYSYKENLVSLVVQFINSKEVPVAQKLPKEEKIKTTVTATNETKGSPSTPAVNLTKPKQPLFPPSPSIPLPWKPVTSGPGVVASPTLAPTTAIPAASHTVSSGSLNAVPSATTTLQKPKVPRNADILEPCNALYIDNLFPGDDGEWELPPECTCKISIHDLIKYVPLPQSMVDALQDMCTKSPQELSEHLQVFGDENAYSSGCRLYLLLQIRDLYEGEAKTLPGFTPGVATVPSDNNIPKPNSATSSVLGSKRKSASATLAFPPPQSKVAKPSSTATSATVTSATVTSGNHIASGTPLSINTSQPQAETAAAKQKRLQAQTELSQDFSKMMSKQLGIPSATHPKPAAPKFALFDDMLENSTEQECCICIASKREVAFVPCGHTVCCRPCSDQLKDCPVCRKKIKTKLTLFWS